MAITTFRAGLDIGTRQLAEFEVTARMDENDQLTFYVFDGVEKLSPIHDDHTARQAYYAAKAAWDCNDDLRNAFWKRREQDMLARGATLLVSQLVADPLGGMSGAAVARTMFGPS